MSDLTIFRSLLAQSPGSVVITFGALTTPGILDFEGQGWGAEGQAPVDVEMLTLTFPYPDLPGLQPGSDLTITDKAGVASSYAVSAGPRRKADGIEAIVLLENA